MPSFTTNSSNLQQSGPLVQIGITIGSATEEAFKTANQPIPNPIQRTKNRFN